MECSYGLVNCWGAGVVAGWEGAPRGPHLPQPRLTGAGPVSDLITGSGEERLITLVVDTDGAAGDRNRTDTITATDRQPFWTPGPKVWADAIDLIAGTWLRTSAGADLEVTVVGTRTAEQSVHTLYRRRRAHVLRARRKHARPGPRCPEEQVQPRDRPRGPSGSGLGRQGRSRQREGRHGSGAAPGRQGRHPGRGDPVEGTAPPRRSRSTPSSRRSGPASRCALR